MTDISENLLRKLDELDSQFKALTRELLDPAVLQDHRQVRTLSIKKAAIEPIVTNYRAWRTTGQQIDELREVIQDGSDM
ncbi:MAG: PCRF domain-containing protein, partial [Planctomycetota bacterium]|nr:PCRF domain-containing protein [Planctomycetota bacterium]